MVVGGCGDFVIDGGDHFSRGSPEIHWGEAEKERERERVRLYSAPEHSWCINRQPHLHQI